MFHKITNVSTPLMPKVLSCLILVIFCLLVVNIYLRSLKIHISSSITVAKSFNSCIGLCNYIITICASITSILKTQVLLYLVTQKQIQDLKIIYHQILSLELKRAGCSWLCKGTSNRGFHYYPQFPHCMPVWNFFRFNNTSQWLKY